MSDQPNFLLLLSDEHGFRHVSHRPEAAGGEPVHTPALDALAANGSVFDAAYCQSPLCTPSRMCLLTGRDQHRCGSWSNSAILRPELPTIPSHLAQVGYETCLVGKLHFGGSRQLAGFRNRPYGDFGGPCGHQSEPLLQGWRKGMGMRSRTLDAGYSGIPESLLQENMTARESLAFLRQHRHRSPAQPWFHCASFSRPHFPLTAPARFLERYWPSGITPPKIGRQGDTIEHPMTLGMAKGFCVDEIGEEEMMQARAAYFACVDFFDEMLGDFLALLERDGFLDNTVVIYTSDHGEMAGEHGLWWKNSWHEAAMRVPFLWQLPEQRRGAAPPLTVEAPVSSGDVFPTVCALAGAAPPPDLDGCDLTPMMRQGQKDRSAGGVTGEFCLPRWGEGTEFRVLRRGRYKYVGFRDAPELFFDLEQDPLEQRNLAGATDAALQDILADVRQEAGRDFDWDQVADDIRRDGEELPARFPKRVECRAPNQILLGDGRLIEADDLLYHPRVVAENPADSFEDWPAHL